MGIKVTKGAPELQFEIEQFYYHEAQLLDDHRYGEWLDLFAGDARYWMPTRANRLLREDDQEATARGEFALFDDNKKTLGSRVKQMESRTHWAENPRTLGRSGEHRGHSGTAGEADRPILLDRDLSQLPGPGRV